jgi:hypothetical protein
MKKWLSFFLLLITLVASFYPCCSADDCGEKTATEQSSHPEEGEDSNCSPFLACGTCTGFTQLTPAVDIPYIAVLPPVHVAKSYPFSASGYTPSLLQPPRYTA